MSAQQYPELTIAGLELLKILPTFPVESDLLFFLANPGGTPKRYTGIQS